MSVMCPSNICCLSTIEIQTAITLRRCSSRQNKACEFTRRQIVLCHVNIHTEKFAVSESIQFTNLVIKFVTLLFSVPSHVHNEYSAAEEIVNVFKLSDTDFDFLKFKRKLKYITCFQVDLLLQETNQVLETPLFQILGG